MKTRYARRIRRGIQGAKLLQGEVHLYYWLASPEAMKFAHERIALYYIAMSSSQLTYEAFHRGVKKWLK